MELRRWLIWFRLGRQRDGGGKLGIQQSLSEDNGFEYKDRKNRRTRQRLSSEVETKVTVRFGQRVSIGKREKESTPRWRL